MPTHSLIHRVQFSETDMAGVVHFSNFFKWMEEVEHDFFRSRGLSVHLKHAAGTIGWPRVNVSCDFAAPARFEDEVTLRFNLTRLGEKSLSYEVEFLLNEKRLAVAKATSVCCVMADRGLTAIPIPPDVRDKLSAPVG
jgi:acyl-CoA thioester hydrolase